MVKNIWKQQFPSCKYPFSSYYRKQKTHIVLKCRSCPVRLIYRKDRSLYIIDNYRNKHNHNAQEITYDQRSKSSIVIERLEHLPKTWSRHQKIKTVQYGLNVSESLIDYSIRKHNLFAPKKSFHEILSQWEKKYTFVVEPSPLSEGQTPQLIIIYCSEWAEWYRKYHRVIYFHYTSSLVNEKVYDFHVRKQEKWITGFVLATNSNCKTIVLALLFIQGKSQHAFGLFWEKFVS